ncbi:carbohydrate ABC transporter permease [Plantactinospora endophytica]|uniref:Sugar ABC transporter permease n=1 Tax=Plantactinospora endophytica TaxID=673535 RepID=A0ABQ4DXX3_9ACTN|nr:carbohydrate ABC transporter permease [Plantactinospora endophytica]GIG86926.1 sugar ABC transporter permease [Plantactinospora endophytica]
MTTLSDGLSSRPTADRQPTADRRPGAAGARLRTAGWHALIIGVLALLLYPVVWLLATSIKPTDEILSSLSLLPSRLAPENYSAALDGIAGIGVWRFFTNSVIVAVGSVIGNLVSCALAAYAFARLRFRLRGPLFAFTLLTIMLPYHVVLIPQYTIFQKLDLVGTFVPLILPKLLATDAFFVFLMVQFIRGLPRELDDAAEIDGCGPVLTFRYVILPLLKPALVTTAIFTFIWTWNDFFSQLVYLNDPESYTLPLALRLFIDQTSESAFGPMFAMSVLSIVPVILFFLAFQRYLVEGIATSGLKG